MTNQEKVKIHSSNLELLTKRQNILRAQKNIAIKDIVNAVCNDEASIKVLQNTLANLNLDLSSDDKISFCRAICSSHLQKDIPALLSIGSNDPTPAGAHSKISFIKNKYNDLAFERFSTFISNAKADYATSFKESCENVTNGFCEFCILPITSSEDGRLMSFYSLLDRYELKICAVTDIEDEDSSKTIRYACVGKASHEPTKKNLKDDIIFEFFTIDSTSDFLSLLILAAKEADAEIVNVDSFPVEYSQHLQNFFFSFRMPYQNSLFFRLLVAINQSNYTPIGLYKEIL